MHERKAVHYIIKSIIVSSECATLKHTVPGKYVLKLVKVTFNQADALKLTRSMVHKRLHPSALVW